MHSSCQPRRGGFKRGGFPIWTCLSRFVPYFTGREKGGFLKGWFWRMCPRSGFCSGEHANVPAFRFFVGGTLVPVFVPGKHSPKPPFWKTTQFWQPPIFVLLGTLDFRFFFFFRGFSHLVLFPLSRPFKNTYKEHPERVRDTIRTFLKKLGDTRTWKPPRLFSLKYHRSGAREPPQF